MRVGSVSTAMVWAVAATLALATSCTSASESWTSAAVGELQFVTNEGREVSSHNAHLGATQILFGRRFIIVESDAEVGPPPENSLTYRVLVERPLRKQAGGFSTVVDQVLKHPRGWQAAGVTLWRVDQDPDVEVVLARPATVDLMCAPLNTGSVLSCTSRRRAILNEMRWKRGATSWMGDLDGYRSYLVNHEFGHLLGARHKKCPAPGEPAPVMMQQTKRVAPCEPNGTPTQQELDELAARRAGTR